MTACPNQKKTEYASVYTCKLQLTKIFQHTASTQRVVVAYFHYMYIPHKFVLLLQYARTLYTYKKA